ncbi:MAG: hypothetical protein KGH98_01355 [Candidatus Micrarchaeota archaeon]|nr:hypothetical protein [Candidatus Micrarchaeota archaeon]
MKSLRKILVAIVVGVAITLLSGVFNITPPGLVGATWYGYPFSWLQWRAISPQYSPWFITPLWGLAADIIFWAVITFVILAVAGLIVNAMASGPRRAGAKRARRRRR